MSDAKSYKTYVKIGMRRHPDPHIISLLQFSRPELNWIEYHQYLIRDMLGIRPNPLPSSCKNNGIINKESFNL